METYISECHFATYGDLHFWVSLCNSWRPTFLSASQTQPTTEAPKCKQHLHQGLLQSHPFRSPQKTIWTDNNHGYKQEPTTRQKLLTTLSSSTTRRSRKDPNTEQLQTTKKPKLLNKLSNISVGHSNIWSEPVHSIIKTVKDKCNLKWLWVTLSSVATDSPTLEKSFKGTFPGNSRSAWPPMTLSPVTAETEEMMSVTTSAGIQQWSTSWTQQHRKNTCEKHTTKVQSWNATTLQWSPKSCQTWWEIGLMWQTFCNPIPWCKVIPIQPTWRNNMHNHVSMHEQTLGQGPKPCKHFGGEDGGSPGNAPSSPSFWAGGIGLGGFRSNNRWQQKDNCDCSGANPGGRIGAAGLLVDPSLPGGQAANLLHHLVVHPLVDGLSVEQENRQDVPPSGHCWAVDMHACKCKADHWPPKLMSQSMTKKPAQHTKSPQSSSVAKFAQLWGPTKRNQFKFFYVEHQA